MAIVLCFWLLRMVMWKLWNFLLRVVVHWKLRTMWVRKYNVLWQNVAEDLFLIMIYTANFCVIFLYNESDWRLDKPSKAPNSICTILFRSKCNSIRFFKNLNVDQRFVQAMRLITVRLVETNKKKITKFFYP